MFEYKMLYVPDRELYDPQKLTDLLDAEGRECWEMTSYNQDAGNGVRFLLKRRSPDMVEVVEKSLGEAMANGTLKREEAEIAYGGPLTDWQWDAIVEHGQEIATRWLRNQK